MTRYDESPPPGPGGNPFAPLRYGELQRVSEHVWCFRNIVNSAIVVADEGVAVIDTQINATMARRLLAALRGVSSAPLRYAVNTHYHWDHWAGNDVFRAAGAQLVCSGMTRHFMATRNVRQRAFLASRGFGLPAEDPRLPQDCFEDQRVLRLGALELELRFLGRAETDDPTAVWVPADRVAVSGDTLMTGSFPILGQPTQNEGLCEDRSWQRTLGRLRALEPLAVVPGHGPVGGVAEIDFFVTLLDWFLDAVRPHVERGLPPAAILAALEPTVPEIYRRMPVTWGTPRYAILRAVRAMTGWQQDKPSALPAPPAAGVAAPGEHPEDYLDAARATIEAGRPGEALALADQAAQRFPGQAAVWLARGRLYQEASRGVASVLERGDFFVEARRSAERALELAPDDGPALAFLGSFLALVAWRNGDDPAEACTLLERAIERPLDAAQEARALFHLGLARRAEEREDEARGLFQRALELDPGLAPARLALSG